MTGVMIKELIKSPITNPRQAAGIYILYVSQYQAPVIISGKVMAQIYLVSICIIK